MKNLNSSEIDKVGGGYLRLDGELASIDVFAAPVMGAILNIIRTPPERNERVFPKSLAMLDY